MDDKMKRISIISITAALILFAGVANSGDDAIDLSGEWKINKELSDDPKEVMAAQMEKMRAQRGGGRGGTGAGRGGRGMGGGRGGMGGGRGMGGKSGMNAERTGDMESRYLLVIEQTDESVTITNARNHSQIYLTDGKSREQQTPRGTATVTSSWNDLRLIIHMKTHDDRERTLIYRINDEGRLEVVTQIHPPRMPDPIEIVAVYDSVPRNGD